MKPRIESHDRVRHDEKETKNGDRSSQDGRWFNNLSLATFRPPKEMPPDLEPRDDIGALKYRDE